MRLKNLIKIKSFSFLFILLLTTKLFAQKTDLQRDHLKGKVRSIDYYANSKLIKTRTYNLKGFETSTKDYCLGNKSTICSQDTFIYNSKGNAVKYLDNNFVIEKNYDNANNLIEEIQTNRATGKIFDKNVFSYSNLRKIKSEYTKYSSDNDVAELTIVINYDYDSNGNLIEEDNLNIRYNKTTKKSKINYKYDKSQNVIEKTESNSAGEILHNYIYKYDSLNQKIEYQSRSSDGYKYTNYNENYKYDKNGHIVESSNYELNGRLLYKDVYEFDKTGNQIKRSHYFGDILTMETVDTFNNLGLMTTEIEYKSNVLVSQKIFNYDKVGNNISTVFKNANGVLKNRLDYKICYYLK